MPAGISYEYITKFEDLPRVAQEMLDSKVVGLDIEATSLRSYAGKIRLVQISTGKNIYVIDLFQLDGDLGPVLSALADESIIKIIQNGRFEQKYFLHHYGIELWPIFDTLRASQILYNGKQMSHDLYSLYSRELGVFPVVSDQGLSDWTRPQLTSDQLLYAAEDVNWLHALREVMKPKLKASGLLRTALIEFGAVLPEAAVENKGFYLDRERWLALAVENKKLAEQYRHEVVHTLPNPTEQLTFAGMDPKFNLNSPKQLIKSLAKLGIETDSTAEMVLAQYVAEYPEVAKLFLYREYSKSVSSFGPDYLKHIDAITGRIHSDFYPFTGAGRYASSNPNLQQIPRDKRFRKCFRAAAGMLFAAADYSGIEMRAMAEASGDPVLTRLFKAGGDAHRHTASIVNKIRPEEVTRQQRQGAKPVNFGFLYGMGAEKFVAYALKEYNQAFTIGEAQTLRSRYFEGYQGVARWQKRTVRDGGRTGLSRTFCGRLRHLSKDKYTEYLNTPIQGSCADGLKKALRRVYKLLKKKYGDDADIVHHVHDEIIAECKKEIAQDVAKDIETGMKEAMEEVLKKVPVDVEAKIGEDWAEVH